MSATDSSHWYVLAGQDVVGPYQAAEVLTYPGLTPETLVCRAGEEEWRALREVPELYSPPVAAPPPLPAVPAAVPDRGYPMAGAIARILTVPRPLLFLALLILVWGGGMLFNAAWRAKVDPRLEEAQSLVLKEKGVEAEALCRAVLAEQPERALAHSLLGDALLSQGRNDEALAAYQQAQKLNPRDARIEQKIIIVRGMGGRM